VIGDYELVISQNEFSSTPVVLYSPTTSYQLQMLPVLTLGDVGTAHAAALLDKYSLGLACIESGADIPGSYWGESEAGLVGNVLFARSDTPMHSVLHEACHFICMRAERRAALNRDAGGDYDEENAVCYLQILLGAYMSGCDSDRLMRDMDTWGYTFRLGSTRAWFAHDAADAHAWLVRENLIDENAQPTWEVRTS
jgi:hypothetical protein